MTKLEMLAVELHEHMWQNMGLSDEWTLQLCGDEREVKKMIRLLNAMRDEIVAHRYNHVDYERRFP